MKNFFFCLFVFIFSLNIYSQTVSVENQCLHSMVVGIPYRFNVASEKISSDSILIVSENCNILKDSQGYYFLPTKFGNIFINIYQLTNNDTIFLEKKDFFANYLPQPTAYFDKSSLFSTVPELLNAKYVYVQTENYEFNFPRTSILEYKIEIRRNKETIYQRIIYGNEIPRDVIDVFFTLKLKDIVCLKDILYQEIDSTQHYAKDGYLIIK